MVDKLEIKVATAQAVFAQATELAEFYSCFGVQLQGQSILPTSCQDWMEMYVRDLLCALDQLDLRGEAS
jgi:hypothetical protein